MAVQQSMKQVHSDFIYGGIKNLECSCNTFGQIVKHNKDLSYGP